MYRRWWGAREGIMRLYYTLEVVVMVLPCTWEVVLMGLLCMDEMMGWSNSG